MAPLLAEVQRLKQETARLNTELKRRMAKGDREKLLERELALLKSEMQGMKDDKKKVVTRNNRLAKILEMRGIDVHSEENRLAEGERERTSVTEGVRDLLNPPPEPDALEPFANETEPEAEPTTEKTLESMQGQVRTILQGGDTAGAKVEAEAKSEQLEAAVEEAAEAEEAESEGEPEAFLLLPLKPVASSAARQHRMRRHAALPAAGGGRRRMRGLKPPRALHPASIGLPHPASRPRGPRRGRRRS